MQIQQVAVDSLIPSETNPRFNDHAVADMARVTLTPDLIRETHTAIRGATIRTPTVPASRLSLQLGIDLHLKLENLQHTNAFKARGALAKLLTLTDAQKKAGVIACSVGNHAQGVAYHATRLGIGRNDHVDDGFIELEETILVVPRG